jgi:hypothetical protein
MNYKIIKDESQEISDRDFLEQKLVVAEQVSALLNNPKDLVGRLWDVQGVSDFTF